MNVDFRVDYLRFCIHFTDDTEAPLTGYSLLNEFLNMFPFFYEDDPAAFDDVDRWKYKKQYFDNSLMLTRSVMILFDDKIYKHDKGLAVDIPAHAIPWFCDNMGFKTVKDLFSWLYESSEAGFLSLTRIDICHDDFSKTFKAFNFNKWFFDGKFRSHFTKARVTGVCSTRQEGQTFYLGSRYSNYMLRIYDKYWQTERDHRKNPEVEIVDSVRYEFELRDDFARNFVYGYLFQNMHFVTLLNKSFSIVSGEDSNKSRDSLDPQWEAFLNQEFSEELNAAELKIERAPSTVDSFRKWLRSAIVPAFRNQICKGHYDKDFAKLLSELLCEYYSAYGLDPPSFKMLQRSLSLCDFISHSA